MKQPTAQELSQIRGVVFDLDDTLVASNIDFAGIRKQVGVPLEQGIIEYIETLQGEARTVAENILLAAEWLGAKQATWMPNARQLVDALNQYEVPLAILTRNAGDIAQAMIDRLNIPIQRLIAREDSAPKPSPDGLLIIANEWQLKPASIVYVGDFQYDIEAADAAGMVSCLYVPEHRRKQSLASNYYGADWVIDDLSVLQHIGSSFKTR